MGTPGIVDPAEMREVMGHFASGVTVVTAVTESGPIGFTSAPVFGSTSMMQSLQPLPFTVSVFWTRAAVAAIWSAELDVLLAPERDAAVPAGAGAIGRSPRERKPGGAGAR